MKSYLLLFLATLACIIGCDSPQRTRAPGNWVNANNLENPPSGIYIPPTTTAGTASGVAGGTASGSTIGTGASGFETCDLTTNKYQTIDIGWFSLCQSKTDERSFKFKTTMSSPTVRICLIPTYRDGNGNSTYVGQPQCAYTTANQEIQGTLYKTRTGLTTSPINGVMVMKEPLLAEYIACMHGYTHWPGNACAAGAAAYCNYWQLRCPRGVQSGGACPVEATNYMGQVCSNFKSKYSSSYLDINTSI